MTLRAESVGDAVVLTLDRPTTRNAIDRATARQLGDAVRISASNPQVRGVVLTGGGTEVFISGGDLKDFQSLGKDEQGGREVMAMFDHLSVCETCEVPVIAAVQGDVLGGGCELLLLCDMVIIESQATLAFRHAKMGLTPAWGGMTRLVERVGPMEASRLMLTAEKVSAEEARRIGLVSEVVPTGGARSRAIALVNRIADNPRATVSALKRTLYAVREARRADSVARERQMFTEMWGGTDHQSAMNAFVSRKGSGPGNTRTPQGE